MRDGFIKVAAATPVIRVADCTRNGEETIRLIEEAEQLGVKVLVFPELGITGYTCGDLFLQNSLLDAAKKTMWEIAKATNGKDVFVFVGLPLQVRDKLYNVAAAILNGEVLGLIPKKYIPNYSEFYEARHFHEGPAETADIFVDGQQVLFGQNLIFTCEPLGMTLAAEICEDLWTSIPPSNFHALAGANVIVNLSASNELVGKGTGKKPVAPAAGSISVCLCR